MSLSYRKKSCDKTKRQDPDAWSKDELVEKCKEKFGGSGYTRFTKEHLCKALKNKINPKEYKEEKDEESEEEIIIKKKKTIIDSDGEETSSETTTIKKKKKEYKQSEDLSKKKVLELKELLRERGMKVSGTKSELIERLQRNSESGKRKKPSSLSKTTTSSSKTSSEKLRDSNEHHVKELLKSLNEHELKSVATNFDINTAQDKKDIIHEILKAYKEDKDESKMIDISQMPKKYRKLFVYLQMLNRDQLKNINKHFKLNTKQSNVILILQVLEYINDNKLVTTIEDLEALTDIDTKIVDVKKRNIKELPSIRELYPKLCELPRSVDQLEYLNEHFTRDEINELANKYNEKCRECALVGMPKRYKFENDKDKTLFIEFIVSSRASQIYINNPRHERIEELYDDFKKGKTCYNFVFSKMNHDGDIIIDDQEIEEDIRVSTSKCIKRSKIPLTEYQKNAVNYLMKNRGLLLYFETGTGKTLTAVTFSQCILRNEPKRHIVVITPKSLQINFKNEIKKYGGDPNDDRYEFYTYDEILHRYKDNTPDFTKNKVLIIDEAHKLRTKITTPRIKKNNDDEEDEDRKKKKSTGTGKKADLIIRASKMAYKVMLLTATPFYNKVIDGLNLLNLLKRENIKKLSDAEIIDELAKMTIYQGKMNDPDFPAFVEKNIFIEMDKEYYRQYKKVENRQHFDYRNPWAFLNGVRRAMNKIEEVSSQKIKKTYEIVEEAMSENKKCLIFTTWLQAGIELLKESLNEIDKSKIAVITGETTKARRAEIVEKYNKRKYNILIISAAGGEGLDLKEVEVAILLDALWSEAAVQQVHGRAIRKKSHANLPLERQKVVIYYLYMSKPADKDDGDKPSADEMMLQIVGDKTKKINYALELLQQKSIENGISMEQVRSSHDSIAFSEFSHTSDSSFVLRRSNHTQALLNAKRNSKL